MLSGAHTGGSCVDTGMGLERVASVMQGKPSNFDGDSVAPLVDAVLELAHIDPASYSSLGQVTGSHCAADFHQLRCRIRPVWLLESLLTT